MTKEQAIKYIWSYCRIPIIVILILIFLLGYFIQVFRNRPGNILVHVSFLNCYDDVSEASDFYQGFIEYADFQKEGEVIFDANVFFDLSRDSDYRNSYYQKTVAYLEAGTTDAVVCQEANLMGLVRGGRILSLEDNKAKEICKKYRERIVNYTTEEGEGILVGIDISDSPVLAEMISYKGGYCLCISAFTGRLEHVACMSAFADIHSVSPFIVLARRPGRIILSILS